MAPSASPKPSAPDPVVRSLAINVASSLVTAYILAWLGGAIAIAAIGGDGNEIQWGAAVGWLFLGGGTLVGLLHGLFAVRELVTGQARTAASRRHLTMRGIALLVTSATLFVVALFLPSLSAVPIVILPFALGLVSAIWILHMAGGGRDRLPKWWRTFAAVTVLVGLSALSTTGMLLGVILRRSTS